MAAIILLAFLAFVLLVWKWFSQLTPPLLQAMPRGYRHLFFARELIPLGNFLNDHREYHALLFMWPGFFFGEPPIKGPFFKWPALRQ